MSKSWRWSDAYFCSLPPHANVYGTPKPQTNVYCHAKITEPGGSIKILLASLSGKFIYVEYQRHFDNLIPTTKEIQFTYIPGDAELISLDAISRSSHGKSLIVGVTFMKVKQGTEENETPTFTQYLNLYSSSQPGEECYLESVAQEGVSIELNFIPYQLTHAELVLGECRETVFLLSGSDQVIHMYRERYPQSFVEETSVNDYFPEFSLISGCVHWLDIRHQDHFTQRLSVLGQKDGIVTASVVDVHKKEILQTWSIEHHSPITSVKIFSFTGGMPPPAFLSNLKGFKMSSPEEDSTVFDVLVLSALEPAVVYSDVINNGLKKESILPDSDKFDVPLCACILDFDFDGENEILIGTYGQELLAYKWFEEDTDSVKEARNSESTPSLQDDLLRNRHRSSEIKRISELDENIISRKSKSQENITTDHEDDHDKEKGYSQSFISHGKRGYRLLWQRSFACPVMGVDRVDIVRDGMDDLVVVTLNGVHIIQPDLGRVFEVCSERLNQVAKTQNPDTPVIKECNGSDKT